ncbi:MAG: hypothetical protein WB678_12860 [Stellaceae bacterium]
MGTMAPMEDGLLTFKFDNKAPVALDDLTVSLNALAQSYQDYLAASGQTLPEEGIKLYIHDLHTGSIIAVLQAIADQGHFLFGENGLVPTAQHFLEHFKHADTLAGFLGSINDVVQFFLGNSKNKAEPTRKQADQIIKIFEPVAKDSGSALNMQFNGPAHIGEIHFHYNSQQANAVQNSARRYLGPTVPTNQILHDELLTLHQVRGDAKSRAGDRGIIESISPSPVKLQFTSEAIKKGILEAPENPFQRVFIVDVEIKTVEGGKPALYKVLALKETFDKPD